jgi:hypothetical protein
MSDQPELEKGANGIALVSIAISLKSISSRLYAILVFLACIAGAVISK